jgi:sugar porter (SP) family MFS transporter
MIIASMMFVIGAALQLTGHVATFYVGCFLTGLGVGPITVIAPLYVPQIAPPQFRGRCIGIFEICYQLGGLMGFWINYGVNLHISGSSGVQWRIPVGMQLPLMLVFLAAIVFLPETPRFLIKTGSVDAATQVLSKLRNLDRTHEYIQQEVTDIRDELNIERTLMGANNEDSQLQTFKRQIKECTKRNILYRISIGVVTQFFGQLSGINGISYSSPRIFRSLGVQGKSAGLFATGIYGVVKAIAALIACGYLVDRIGRRTLLLAGASIMSFSNFFVGSYIKIGNQVKPMHRSAEEALQRVLSSIHLYVIGFVSSFAGVPFILASETVPISVRAISATLGAATQWIMNVVVSKATPYLITDIGHGTFFSFGSCFVGGIYVWFFVPETKSLPLEHMAVAFGHEDVVSDHRRLSNKEEEVGGVREIDETREPERGLPSRV